MIADIWPIWLKLGFLGIVAVNGLIFYGPIWLMKRSMRNRVDVDLFDVGTTDGSEPWRDGS